MNDDRDTGTQGPAEVAFIGLGQMGSAIAGTLLADGYAVHVWNRSPAASDALAAAGASVAASVADACRGRDLVVTMLADDAALTAIEDELVAALGPGAVHVAMGTHGVDKVAELAVRHADAGQQLVAAPVIGRPQAAAAGELVIVAAGPADALARCARLFAVAGRQMFAAGDDPVAAAAIKLTNNFALACAVEAMAEAFAFARAYGVEAQTVHDVFVNGMFKGSPVYAGYGRRMVDAAFEPAGFRASLALKDIDLVRAAADARAVPLPGADVCRDTLVAALEHGDGNRDWAVVGRQRARAAGLDEN